MPVKCSVKIECDRLDTAFISVDAVARCRAAVSMRSSIACKCDLIVCMSHDVVCLFVCLFVCLISSVVSTR